MIFMSVNMLLNEFYDIYGCVFSMLLDEIYMSFSMLLVEMYDIYVCQYTHALLTSDLDLSSE